MSRKNKAKKSKKKQKQKMRRFKNGKTDRKVQEV